MIMGSLCSCFHVSDDQDKVGSNNSGSKDCVCPKCCIRRLLNNHTDMIDGPRGTDPLSPPVQQVASSNSPVLLDNSSDKDDMPADEPVAIDEDHIDLEEQCIEVRREEDKENCSRVVPEQCVQTDHVQLYTKSIERDKTLKSHIEDGCLDQDSKSLLKVLSPGVENDSVHSCPSADDQDVCPTCLEEYTIENPKITLKCSHIYHLSCIYEWMERSANCPVCGEVFQFCKLLFVGNAV